MPKRKATKKRTSKKDVSFAEFFKVFDDILPEPSVSINYDRTIGNRKTVEFTGQKDVEQTFSIIESLDYGKFDKLFHKHGRPRAVAVVFETIADDGSKNYFTKFTDAIHGQEFVESSRKGLRKFAKESLEKMYDEFVGGTGAVEDLELLNKLAGEKGEKTYADLLDDENEYSQKLDPAKVSSMTFKFFYR